MAGVTDRPFRNLCHQLGADLCVSEMVTSQKHLWNSKKTQLRMDHTGETGIRSVQIAGTNPSILAEAAMFNVEHGAQIIDINMGCPAKKVCNVSAGSALLKNESLVADILNSVVSAVDVPVTLKIRTGWDRQNKNAVTIARIAQDNGIQALFIHGRTREDAYKGEAEYETISAVKHATTLPVIANGDIDSPEKAKKILQLTGADGLMIGRAAQGNPWIFKQIKHYLEKNEIPSPPDNTEVSKILIKHLQNLHQFYGELSGVRIARKHIGWYIKHKQGSEVFRKQINKIDNANQQIYMVTAFLNSSSSTWATEAA